MPTILEAKTQRGTSRRCDAVCHNAKPGSTCGCICGGAFHGIGRDRALAVSPERLSEVREDMRIDSGGYVQLRIGA